MKGGKSGHSPSSSSSYRGDSSRGEGSRGEGSRGEGGGESKDERVLGILAAAAMPMTIAEELATTRGDPIEIISQKTVRERN